MLSEYFWNDPAYPRKSDNWFHRSPIFITQSRVPPPGVVFQYGEPRAIPLDLMPHTNPEDRMAFDTWNNKSKHWKQFRKGWYKGAKQRWLMTPWAELNKRHTMYAFEEAFSTQDTVTCASIAIALVETMKWDQDMRTLKADLPSMENPHNVQWVWHTIGLLMMASIPLRHMRITGTADAETWISKHSPSQGAAAAGHSKTVHIYMHVGQDTPPSVGPSEFYNVSGMQYHFFTQFHYIDRVEEIIKLLMMSGAPVHEQFLKAVSIARMAIRTDREALANVYPGRAHTTKWASRWFFEFPEYDPTHVVFDRSFGDWRPVKVEVEGSPRQQ
ncbi:hypothetical protein F4802DRAFT_60757 [Xylaria palmicola]|nr:hypothetical protein F4802DRAFT_60757 [Xylaria palmicola]